MNKVQTAAYELIQSDARFLYTLTDVQQNAPQIKSNYILMSQPYIGIFTDGAEQWCRKVSLVAPTFNGIEKDYYTSLRLSHKLFEKSYSEYKSLLIEKFNESEQHFYSIRRLREKIFGYYNVGTDLCNNEFCGNTILCALYTPILILGDPNAGNWIKNISIIAGKLANYFKCTAFTPYNYNIHIDIEPKDYHFYKSCPLKRCDEDGFLLFSILCSINYVTQFIENFFVDEIPQKLKFAYLLYYYLCDFIADLNNNIGIQLSLNTSLQNRAFRNCLAHYGLGQVLNESDIIENDLLKGLTQKVFNMDYLTVKNKLFGMLNNLSEQIKLEIFN